MVVTKAHIKLSWGGTLGTPASEVWTNSLSFSGVTDADSEQFNRDDLVDMMPEIKTILSAWVVSDGVIAPSANLSLISPHAHLSWIKLNKIGTNGLYIDNPNTVEFADVSGANSQTSAPLWQQSTVISFLTATERGRGSRGRIYPPACGTSPGPDGYMNAEVVDKMQAAAVTLIGDLNKVEPTLRPAWVLVPRWNAVVVSNEINGKPALLTPITHLYVDRIPDVQRRRVNRLPRPSVAPTSVYINT